MIVGPGLACVRFPFGGSEDDCSSQKDVTVSAAQACAIAAEAAGSTMSTGACDAACGDLSCVLPESYTSYESAEAGEDGGSSCPADGGPVDVQCWNRCGH